MRAAIIAAALVLSVGAGACVASTDAPAASPIPAPRYQVIADMLTMEQRIDQLERDLSDAHNEIDVLQLLRAHDIQMQQRERAEDQKRIVSLEWTLQGQPWSGCVRYSGDNNNGR